MEVHVNTSKAVDELSYTAIALLTTLETDVKLVSAKNLYPKYACFVNQFQNLVSWQSKCQKYLCNFPINTLATYIL